MAIPRANREVLRMQAKGGRKGVEAYQAKQGELKQQRNNAVERAMREAALRGAPGAAVQQQRNIVANPYDQGLYMLGRERSAFAADTAASRESWAQYNQAVNAARSLIPGQVAAAVAPIRAEARYNLASQRMENQSQLQQIESQTRLTEAQMKAAAEAYLRQKAEAEAAAARARAEAARASASQVEPLDEDELAAYLEQGAQDIIGPSIGTISRGVRRGRRAARGEYNEINPSGQAAVQDAQARLNALLNAPPAVTADEQTSRDARIEELRGIIAGGGITSAETDWMNRVRTNLLASINLAGMQGEQTTTAPDISNLPVDVGANISPEPISAPPSISREMGYGLGEQVYQDIARENTNQAPPYNAPQMLPPEIPGNVIEGSEVPEVTWNVEGTTPAQEQAALYVAAMQNAAMQPQLAQQAQQADRTGFREFIREQYPQGFAGGPRVENRLEQIGGPQGAGFLNLLGGPIYRPQGVAQALGGAIVPRTGEVAPTAPQALDLAVQLAGQRLAKQLPRGSFTGPEFAAAAEDVYEPGATYFGEQAEEQGQPTPQQAWQTAEEAAMDIADKRGRARREFRENAPERQAQEVEDLNTRIANQFFADFNVPLPTDVGEPGQIAQVAGTPEFQTQYNAVREQLVAGVTLDEALSLSGVFDPFAREIMRSMLSGAGEYALQEPGV